MTVMAEMADRLKKILEMDTEPVGVRIFSLEEEPPAAATQFETDRPVKSYCQALTLAARGRTTFGGREKLGCVLGTATLGLEPDPEPLVDDTVLEKYGVGLFETEEASRKSVELAPKFKAGANRAALIGPIGSLPVEPQIAIFEVDPEQAMWLLYAANYRRGGAQQLPQSGGVAGGCADVTTVVLFNGEVNVTFLGLGCRIKSAIPREHILLGLPFGRIEELTANLEKMAKPIAMLAKARG
jgi:uncharacterized protein (DUF169 family)